MIVGSLVLILSAAGLLAAGLVLGSDWLLGASIVASLIAAVMLYIGARQSAATRAERRAAAAWEAEEQPEEFDRRDAAYPAAPGRAGYPEPDPYDAAGRPEEQRFDERTGYDTDEQFEAPDRIPGEDRFADLREYEDAAFSAPDNAAYDRRAGYPEPPVAERMWERSPTERVPLQRDVNGAGSEPDQGVPEDAGTDHEPGRVDRGHTEPVPTAEHPVVTPPGVATEAVTGQHATVEPLGPPAEPTRAEPPDTEPAHIQPPRTEPEPVGRQPQEAPVGSSEARRLDQLPPDEWVGGGIDDEDPKDEPPIQRRTVQVAAAVARIVAEVFVIDGRPRYHVAGCVHLLGRESEPLPADEAVDLGFTPCSLCEPDTVLTSGSTEKARH